MRAPTLALLMGALPPAGGALAARPAPVILPAPACAVREPARPESRLELPAPGRRKSEALQMAAGASLVRKGSTWRADLSATSTAAADREVVLSFTVRLPGSLTSVFCADGQGERPAGAAGSVAYRHQSALPAITFYNARQGITLVAPFEVPAPGLVFHWKREGETARRRADRPLQVTAEVTNLRLGPAARARATLIAVAHEGDWRPGLGWMVRRYPAYFRPPNPAAVRYDGPMIYDFVTPETRLRRDLGQGLAWQELGWYWPHLGLYLPEGQEWRRQPGSEGGLGEGGSVTRVMLSDYIRRATRLGVGQFLYFQSTESWAEYAAARYPESRTADGKGGLLPTWVKCVVMNPDPAYPFGQHIARQANALTDTFPQMAGFFWDQNCYTHFDYAHDDGISMAEGRPVSMMEIAQSRLHAQVTPRIHARGKAIFTNGAYTVGLSRYCDGVMSEGSGWTRRLQFICMMKPLCLLSYDSSLAAAKEKVRLALETGAQPAVTLGDDACRAFFDGYRPIFRLLQGKEWVFHPKALALPGRWRGNIFRGSRGSFVVTLVPPDGDEAAPAGRPPVVRVRLPQAERPRAVYLLAPEARGLRRLPVQESGGVYSVRIPTLASCGALLLARQGVWVGATAPGLVLGEGDRPAIEAANLRPRPLVGAIRVRGLAGTVQRRLSVAPFGRQRIDVGAPPAKEGTLGLQVSWRSKDGGQGEERIEIPVLAPVAVQLGAGPEPAQLLMGETVPCLLTNRSSRPMSVTLRAGWEAGPKTTKHFLRLGPEGAHVPLPVDVPNGGRWTLLVSARWAGGYADKALDVDVLDSFLPEGFRVEDVAGATLHLSAFNSLGDQWAEKPVSINDVPVGRLPITGSTLRWHDGLTLDVDAEAARKALAAGRDLGGYLLRVAAGNAVQNCFKTRDVRVVVRLASGETVSSTWARQVRCSDPGWLYAEGKSVPLGQPVPLGDVRLLGRVPRRP